MVGAGIVGCTVAYALARSGARVQVIETRTPGQGATRASAGILAPYIEGHSSAALRSLGKRSLDLYDDFMTRLLADGGRDVFYRRNGTFELAFSEADVDRLSELSQTLAKDSIESRWVPPSGFRELEPLAASSARGALLIPTHGFVGVTSLTLAAAAAAEKSGATFTVATGAIRIFSVSADRVGVQTSTMTLRGGSRGAGGGQLVVNDHGGRRRSDSRQTDPRTVDSTANRPRSHRPRHLGARRISRPVARRHGARRIDR